MDHHIQAKTAARRRHAVRRRRNDAYLIKSSARRLAMFNDLSIRETLDLCTGVLTWWESHPLRQTRFPRLHLKTDVGNLIAASRTNQRRRETKTLATTSSTRDARDEEEEGRDLAASEVPLPSDGFRLVRRPATLEREEAFHFASTAKIHVQATPKCDDAQVAELYHQGLLYDNDEDRPEEVFSLNSIQHEEPVYTIRPAKRSRKSKKADMGGSKPLHLALSFTDLGDYEAIARYIQTSTAAAAAAAAGYSGNEAIQHASLECANSFPPLRIIYESATSGPSFDVETSQPPDLMTDSLSDYDCFSDSEEIDRDLPTQREVLENANNLSSETWIMLG